ncbi:unnamed protein product [Lupinus luteus]|uniref:Uncharacterized protein n=1 Tax=Lupinus luteus TaxID=3873 RepID=A0AAV1XAV1_LUPLU
MRKDSQMRLEKHLIGCWMTNLFPPMIQYSSSNWELHQIFCSLKGQVCTTQFGTMNLVLNHLFDYFQEAKSASWAFYFQCF